MKRTQRIASSEVVYKIRALIRDQELMPGERLGSERALAQLFGITRSDLRIALAQMESQHEIVRKIGRAGGIVVSDGKIERNLNTIESLPIIARRQGWRITSQVISASIQTATPADARILQLPGASPKVFHIVRLRNVNDEPLSIEHTFLPAALFPGFLEHDVSQSLYTLFEQLYDVRVKFADETLQVITANDNESQYLNIPADSSLFMVHRIAYTAQGVPIERGIDRYRTDRIRFTMNHSGYVRLSATERLSQ